MDDGKLIEFVRNCPCLYDKSNVDLKDREKKRRAWMEIASSLEVDETTVIKRWGNLRERFSKEIRSNLNTSGSGAYTGRQWALLDNLQFLKRHIIPRPMRQSKPILECSVEHAVDDEILNVYTESPSPSAISPAQLSPVSSAQSTPIPPAPLISRPRKRRAAQLDEIDTTILAAVKTFQEVCARKARREEISEEISGFGTMICSAISKMKKTNQALVMRRCTEIVMQAQVDEHEEMQEE